MHASVRVLLLSGSSSLLIWVSHVGSGAQALGLVLSSISITEDLRLGFKAASGPDHILWPPMPACRSPDAGTSPLLAVIVSQLLPWPPAQPEGWGLSPVLSLLRLVGTSKASQFLAVLLGPARSHPDLSDLLPRGTSLTS